MRSDKTHGHKPRRHIKLLLFLTGCGSSSCARVLSAYPRSLPLPFSYGILCHTWVRREPHRSSLFHDSFSSLSLSLTSLVPSFLPPCFSFSALRVFPSRARPRGIPRGLSLSSFQTCVLPAAAHAPTRRPPIPFHKVLPLPRAWVLPRMGDVRSRMVSRRWLRAR